MQTAQPVVWKAATVSNCVDEYAVRIFRVDDREGESRHEPSARAARRWLAMLRKGRSPLGRGLDL